MAPTTLQRWATTSRRNVFEEKDSHSHKRPRRGDDESLPTSANFSSNHVMVNRARAIWGLEPLRRSRTLDQLAKQHAQRMAAARKLVHSTKCTDELCTRLKSAHVSENIQRGSTIKKMHLSTLQNRQSVNRKNLRSDVNEMGMGTAKGADGKLYMCQLFRFVEEDDNSAIAAN